MGGTWVHWFQPHVYREISRYDMKDELALSPDYSREKNYFSFVTEHGARNMSHEEEVDLILTYQNELSSMLTRKSKIALFSRAVEKFANVDGNLGKGVMPLPFDQYANEAVRGYADMSVADRLEQIKNDLTDDERNAISAVVLVCSGGTRENSSFLDFLRWWAAGNYNYPTLLETVLAIKLRCGQSAFALRFFKEALASGRLSYSFNTAVCQVDCSSHNIVTVHSRDGRTFRAKRVVCTVPLNVMDKVQFHPALNQAKLDAIRHKHVNQCTKLHAEVNDPEMRSWGGVTYPNNKLLLGAADGTTPSGNTHCVFFGCSENQLHAEEDIEEALKAVNAFAPMEVERLVSDPLSFQQGR